MTEQDRQQQPESLADGLANWTPPWARPAVPADAETTTVEPADVPDDELSDDTTHSPPPEPATTVAGPLRLEPPDDGPEPSAEAVATPAEPTLQDDDPHPPGESPDDEVQLSPPPDAASDADIDDAGDLPHDEGAPEASPTEDPGTEGPSATDVGVPEDEEPVPPEPIDLRGALEAILLVVDEPVTEVVLAQILEQPTQAVGATLRALADEYTDAGRGFDLRRAAGGWRLYTRTEFAPYVERFVLDGQQVRLTQAALETLAVVAYKQPVTRPRISAIRGVNCDGVIRTLLTRGLIEECGAEPDSGAHLYRTTALFCEKLGIDAVDDLPPLAPFLPDDLPQDLTDVIDTERAQMRGGNAAKTRDAATSEPDASEANALPHDDASHE